MSNSYINKVTLPHMVSVNVIKENKSNFSHFYIYNPFFFYKLSTPVRTKATLVDSNSNSLVFKENTKVNYSDSFQLIFSNFLFSWDYFFFEKIKFTGKGYRITFRRKKKYIIFYFGHSHDTIMVFRNIKLKKPHKYKFLILKNSFSKIKMLGFLITKIKPINVYTKRGIRKSRQCVYKRKSNKATF